MDEGRLYEELRQAAERLGVGVRVEPFETAAAAGGGGCVLRGKPLILLDAGAPLETRIRALARALSTLDTETIYVMPEARELLERAARGFTR